VTIVGLKLPLGFKLQCSRKQLVPLEVVTLVTLFADKLSAEIPLYFLNGSFLLEFVIRRDIIYLFA